MRFAAGNERRNAEADRAARRGYGGGSGDVARGGRQGRKVAQTPTSGKCARRTPAPDLEKHGSAPPAPAQARPRGAPNVFGPMLLFHQNGATCSGCQEVRSGRLGTGPRSGNIRATPDRVR